MRAARAVPFRKTDQATAICADEVDDSSERSVDRAVDFVGLQVDEACRQLREHPLELDKRYGVH
jgi:hypothetical protein